MMLSPISLVSALVQAELAAVAPPAILPGTYVCTTVERAAIVSMHLEGSGDPRASAQNELATRFRIRVALDDETKRRYRIDEIEYDGADRDQVEWQDENSVLHSIYLGDGNVFNAIQGPAFVTFGQDKRPHPDGQITFSHAGFESAGGEDTNLAIRWGRCRQSS